MSAAPLRVYSYPRCSTCRKALSWLAERGLTPGVGLELLDITATPPSLAELQQALTCLGDRRRLFNTSGQSYRALGASTVAAFDDPEALAALAADGKLIKRPFLLTASGQALVGFRPEEWAQALGL